MKQLEFRPDDEIRLHYAEKPAFTLSARAIAVWNRGDIAAPVMSASSGPKDYIKNEIFALFEAQPLITRIVMLRRVGGVTFYLFQDGAGRWFDNIAKQVIAE